MVHSTAQVVTDLRESLLKCVVTQQDLWAS